MVKIGGKEIGIDQGLNLYIGAGAAVTGAVWLFKPEKAHRQYVTGSSSKLLTRLGGAYLGAVAASQFVAGLSNDAARNKSQLKIAAGLAAALAAAGGADWKQGGEMRGDRVKAFTVANAAHSALCLYRGAYVAPDGTVRMSPA